MKMRIFLEMMGEADGQLSHSPAGQTALGVGGMGQ